MGKVEASLDVLEHAAHLQATLGPEQTLETCSTSSASMTTRWPSPVAKPGAPVVSSWWSEHEHRLARLAGRQFFFIGGAPRSGTTWLQQILDSHPDVCCRGEGLFSLELAVPLDALIERRRTVIRSKNTDLFSHTGGYPLPDASDADAMLGTAILCALDRQLGPGNASAVGEKTPENVFLFPRLLRLFPNARFIGIARDPRDVLASSWHKFQQRSRNAGEDNDRIEEDAKFAFLRHAMPWISKGARCMLELAQRYPAACLNVTYEDLQRSPVDSVRKLFRHIGVVDDVAVAQCSIERTSFDGMVRSFPGAAGEGQFLRKGVIGDWPSTLTPAMADLVLVELGWMFPLFGWDV